MQFRSKSGNANFPLSTKDTILGVLCAFSGLLCFALSFSLLQENGRPYLFSGCLAVCLVCLLLTEKKKELVLATAAFILLRVFWAILVSGLRIL
jgi:glucose dehydrogenase